MTQKESPSSANQDATTGSAEDLLPLAKRLFASVRAFLGARLSIVDNAKPTETIQGIERDIEFKGFTIWILIVAIVIASVGLNANSTAVVIGAMLISPLMGPIMGIGLSVGINDFTMLKRGLRNLGIAVGVSIVTSTLFFMIIPIEEASSELLARTRPDIRDVFIAFFGGLAGILAGSRREKSNVIPGVAIATALMPPLCTAGFGLATGQFKFFLGAAYLFLINAFFIALATVIVVRYLRFPVKTFVNEATQTRTKRLLALTVVVMIIPASVIFYQVVIETIAKRNIEAFIIENIEPYDESEIVKKEIILTDSVHYVNLVMFGEPIPAKTVQNWQKELATKVDKGRLRIFQGTDKEALPEVTRLVEMYTSTQEDITNKEDLIIKLQETIKRYEDAVIPNGILKEIKINYPEVASVRMGRMIYTNYREQETEAHPSFYVLWEPKTPDSMIPVRSEQLQQWLATRFQADSVIVASLGKDTTTTNLIETENP